MSADPFVVHDDPCDPHVRAAWDAVLKRLSYQLLPNELVAFVDAFAARQRTVVPAIAAVDDAAERLEDCEQLVGQGLWTTMRAIDELVRGLKTAGLATQERPFGRLLSCDKPTLKSLLPPWQIGAVRCLHRRLLRAGLSTELSQQSERGCSVVPKRAMTR